MSFGSGSLLRRCVAAAAVSLAVAVPLLTPGSAKAYWWHGYWRPGVVVVAPPVVVEPPPYAYGYPHRYAHWVPPHYDARGFFIRGHWA